MVNEIIIFWKAWIRRTSPPVVGLVVAIQLSLGDVGALILEPSFTNTPSPPISSSACDVEALTLRLTASPFFCGQPRQYLFSSRLGGEVDVINDLFAAIPDAWNVEHDPFRTYRLLVEAMKRLRYLQDPAVFTHLKISPITLDVITAFMALIPNLELREIQSVMEGITNASLNPESLKTAKRAGALKPAFFANSLLAQLARSEENVNNYETFSKFIVAISAHDLEITLSSMEVFKNVWNRQNNLFVPLDVFRASANAMIELVLLNDSLRQDVLDFFENQRHRRVRSYDKLYQQVLKDSTDKLLLLTPRRSNLPAKKKTFYFWEWLIKVLLERRQWLLEWVSDVAVLLGAAKIVKMPPVPDPVAKRVYMSDLSQDALTENKAEELRSADLLIVADVQTRDRVIERLEAVPHGDGPITGRVRGKILVEPTQNELDHRCNAIIRLNQILSRELHQLDPFRVYRNRFPVAHTEQNYGDSNYFDRTITLARLILEIHRPERIKLRMLQKFNESISPKLTQLDRNLNAMLGHTEGYFLFTLMPAELSLRHFFRRTNVLASLSHIAAAIFSALIAQHFRTEGHLTTDVDDYKCQTILRPIYLGRLLEILQIPEASPDDAAEGRFLVSCFLQSVIYAPYFESGFKLEAFQVDPDPWLRQYRTIESELAARGIVVETLLLQARTKYPDLFPDEIPDYMELNTVGSFGVYDMDDVRAYDEKTGQSVSIADVVSNHPIARAYIEARHLKEIKTRPLTGPVLHNRAIWRFLVAGGTQAAEAVFLKEAHLTPADIQAQNEAVHQQRVTEESIPIQLPLSQGQLYKRPWTHRTRLDRSTSA